jgi:hypothetical protein
MSLRMVNSTPMIASYDCTDKCPPIQTGELAKSPRNWEQPPLAMARIESDINSMERPIS